MSAKERTLMFYILLAPLILVPILEIYLFIQVGSAIGAGWTILLIFLTAIIGALLVREQGLKTWFEARRKMQNKETPAREVFDGLCLLLAGAFLITPGFFTDSLGFLLLVPAVRTFLLTLFTDELLGMYTFGFVDTEMAQNGYSKAKEKANTYRSRFFNRKLQEKAEKGEANGTVVDAEFEEVAPEDKFNGNKGA